MERKRLRLFTSVAAARDAFTGKRSVVVIGKFDGLHLGHQLLLETARRHAAAEGMQTVVLTFTHNPLKFLRPADCPPAIMSPGQRLHAFAAAGVDACLMLDFDAGLAATPAEVFVREVLHEGLNASRVVFGPDFRFGNRGLGDAALLERTGELYGFTAQACAWQKLAGNGKVSSSLVRSALAEGRVDDAAAMLGRPHEVAGEVVPGDRRGRELGFATANLAAAAQGFVPADGVYAGWVRFDDGFTGADASKGLAAIESTGAEVLAGAGAGRLYLAAISVGSNPTFTPAAASRVEAHILDFAENIYGKQISVLFARRLRGMQTFAGVADLVAAMREDVVKVKKLLS